MNHSLASYDFQRRIILYRGQSALSHFMKLGAYIICAHSTLLLPWIHLESQAIASLSRRSLMDFQGELKRRVPFPQSRDREAWGCVGVPLGKNKSWLFQENQQPTVSVFQKVLPQTHVEDLLRLSSRGAASLPGRQAASSRLGCSGGFACDPSHSFPCIYTQPASAG